MLDKNIMSVVRNINNVNIDENMKSAAKIFCVIFELLEIIRIKGLLHIYCVIEEDGKYYNIIYDLCEREREFFKRGIRLIVDGVDAEHVRNILEYTWYANCENLIDFFNGYIITNGLLFIQDGMNPRIVKEELLALIAFKNRIIFDGYFEDFSKVKSNVLFDID